LCVCLCGGGGGWRWASLVCITFNNIVPSFYPFCITIRLLNDGSPRWFGGQKQATIWLEEMLNGSTSTWKRVKMTLLRETMDYWLGGWRRGSTTRWCIVWGSDSNIRKIQVMFREPKYKQISSNFTINVSISKENFQLMFSGKKSHRKIKWR
jgi:hypothetical protein